MNRIARMTMGLTLAATMAACSPSPPSGEPEAAQQPAEDLAVPPPAAVPAQATPVAPPSAATGTAPSSGSMVVYACDDGSSLTVTYDENSAMVKLPSGSTTLSRAESVSAGGDEAYMGEELSLYRNGSLVQLQVAGKPRTCSKSSDAG